MNNNHLLQESTFFLSKEVIYGATHEVTSTNQGAQVLENGIQNGCKVH